MILAMTVIMIIISGNWFISFFVVSFALLLLLLAMVMVFMCMLFYNGSYYLLRLLELNLNLAYMKLRLDLGHLHRKVLDLLASHYSCHLIMYHTPISLGVNYELNSANILLLSHFPYLHTSALLHTFNTFKFACDF